MLAEHVGCTIWFMWLNAVNVLSSFFKFFVYLFIFMCSEVDYSIAHTLA